MTTLHKALMALVTFGLAAPVAAQPWRYVDKGGAVNYTSNPYELPPKQRAKALKALEEAAARRKAEAERLKAQAASVQAQGGTISATEGLPPPVAKPVILDNDGDGKAEKPDPMKAWRKRQAAAQAKVKSASAALKAAEKAAAVAQRNAFNSPSGPNYARHQQAQDALKARKAAANSARAEAARVQSADPRGYRRR